MVEACALAAMDALRAFAEAVGVDYPDDDGQGDGPDRPSDPGAPIDDVLVELLPGPAWMLDDPMPPLSLLLTAAGLEVVHGAVLLGGRRDPDEVRAWRREEIRCSRWPAAYRDARPCVSAEDLGQFLSVLTSRPGAGAGGGRGGAQPGRCGPARTARRAAATPVQRAAAALLAARAAEGDGRPVEAEDWSWRRSATTDLDPGLLWDAADYAATAATPQAPTRTAPGGCRAGGRLRRALRPLLVSPPRPRAQRPCPCGSGRKYKQCCLRTPSYPLSTRAPARYASIAAYAMRAQHRGGSSWPN